MSSSLASQLVQVRSLNADRLSGSRAASRVQSTSYLFPPSVAATQDIDTLFGIAANGWEEVCQTDSAFESWGTATGSAALLFGDGSKHLDRLTKTQEENTLIDAAISSFLVLVGDNLLDRSAGKCIEWLVRRFRAHEFNVDAILAAFMPFHETQEFARMLQILKLNDKPQFSFLVPVQKQSIPLPSSVLISTLLQPPQTTNSTVVLRWIVALPLDYGVEGHSRRTRHVACSFWLSVIVKLSALWSGAGDIFTRMGLTKSLGKRKQSREDDAQSLLSILLPAILRLMHAADTIRDAPSYSSMALCAVANAFDLSVDAAKGVLDSITSTSSQAKRSRMAILTASATVLSRQEGMEDLSSDSSRLISANSGRKLANMLGDGSIIANLTSTADWSAFAKHLGLTLASLDDEDDEGFQASLLWIFSNQSGLSQDAKSLVLRRLLLKGGGREISDAFRRTLSDVRLMEPNIWDKTLSSIMRQADEDICRRLERLMSSIIAGQAGLNAEDAGTTGWLGVYGAESSGRLRAWRSIVKSTEQGTLREDESIVQDTLKMILTEGNADNLAEAYNSPSLVVKIIGIEGLIRILETQMSGDNKVDGSDTRRDIATHMHFVVHSLIMQNLAGEADQVSLFSSILWPRLLITKATKQESAKLFQEIQSAMKSAKNKKQTIVQTILTHIATAADSQDLTASKQGNTILASAICQDIAANADLIRLFDASERRSALLSNLVLMEALHVRQDLRFVDKAISKVKAAFEQGSATCSSTTAAELAKELVDKIYTKPDSIACYNASIVALLATLAEHCPLADAAILGNATGTGASAIALIFACATSLSQSNPALSKHILSTVVRRLGTSSITLFANIWSASIEQDQSIAFEPSIRLLALRYASAYFDGQSRSSETSLIDFQTLLPSILVALQDPEKRVRVEALDVVKALLHLATLATKGEADAKNVEIFGYDVIYGPATADGLTYLDTAETTHFLHQLYDARDSFVNDAQFVPFWLQQTLSVNKAEGKKLSSRKRAVVHCLSTHVLCWNNGHARTLLLRALANVSSDVRLRSLVPLVKRAVEGEDIPEDHQGLLFALYDKSARSMIARDESSCWTLFKQALTGGSSSCQRQSAKALRERTFVMLSPEQQADVVDLLASLTTTSDQVLQQVELRKCLGSLHIDASVLVPILIRIREAISAQLTATPKRKRSRVSNDDGQGVITSVSKLLELLEKLLSQKQTTSSALMTELFEILRLATELYLSSYPLAEQLLQVTMSNINKIMTAFSASADAPTETFEPLRVESLVNVIKMPCKPQTFQQALLLLSLVGQRDAELVLQHSMPIFSFVGSTVLQRDDEHSFNVIEKTLASILPPVVESIRKDKAANRSTLSFMQASRPLLSIFTDAAMHIPRHRRQTFFSLLADIAGPADFCPAICMLLVDRQAYKVAKMSEKEEIEAALQLPLSLCRHVEDDVDIIMKTLGETMEEVVRTWQHRTDGGDVMQKHVFLDCLRDVDSEHGGRKMDWLKRINSLLHFVRLAVRQNRDAIEDGRIDEDERQSAMRDDTLQNIVHHGLALTRSENAAVANVAQETLDEIMTIVSVSTLEHVTSALLNGNDEAAQRNGLQIASTSIDAMMDDERRQAASFTSLIIGKAKAVIVSMDVMTGTTTDTTVSAALDALRSILSRPQPSEHAALADVTLAIAEISKRSEDVVLVERTMDILRRLCETLGPRLIPMLAVLVKTCKEMVVDTGGAADRRHEENALNVFTALIRSVPSFMSTYLADIFGMCVEQGATLSESGSMRKMLSAACRYVSPNDVLHAISAVHSAQRREGADDDVYVHLFCLDVLQLCIRSMDKQKTLSYHKQIFRFLVNFFDVRRQCIVSPDTLSLSAHAIDEVEARAVGVFVRLVFRLSEAVFRPLFLRLCDWAVLDLADDDGGMQDDRGRIQIRARQVVLYKLLNALLQELGELVTHYYSNVLDASIDLLAQLAEENTSDETLWQPVVNSVKICASADSSGFWNATRTNKLLPVLIAQLRTSVVRQSAPMQRLLSDTIAQLCTDVSDEACVKRANDGLLMLTRDTAGAGMMQTRLIALRTLDRLWRTKGCEDSLLTLVPETVPSIAELLQEGEQTLQPAVSTLVGAIEEILGEGLESYLQ